MFQAPLKLVTDRFLQVACSITSDFRSSAPMLTGSLRSSSELLSSGANSQFSKPTALLDLPLDPSRLSKSLELGPSTNVNQQERRFSDYCTLCPQCRQKSLLSSGGFSTNETLPPEGEIVCSDHTLVPDKPIQSTKSPSSLTSLTSENTEKISTPSRFQRKSLPAIIAPDLTEEDLPSLRWELWKFVWLLKLICSEEIDWSGNVLKNVYIFSTSSRCDKNKK